MIRYTAVSALALLGACAEQAAETSAPEPAEPEAGATTAPDVEAETETGTASLDAVAEDYVKLSLALEAHDPGFVDAYYGPEDWRTAAE